MCEIQECFDLPSSKACVRLGVGELPGAAPTRPSCGSGPALPLQAAAACCGGAPALPAGGGAASTACLGLVMACGIRRPPCLPKPG